MKKEFARWWLLIWQMRRDAAKREYDEAWTGLDMKDAERRMERAAAKVAKWRRVLEVPS